MTFTAMTKTFLASFPALRKGPRTPPTTKVGVASTSFWSAPTCAVSLIFAALAPLLAIIRPCAPHKLLSPAACIGVPGAKLGGHMRLPLPLLIKTSASYASVS